MSLVSELSKEVVAAKVSEGFRFVTIPSEDIYGYQFEGLWNNKDLFGPGTHLLAPGLADALEDRLKAWNRAQLRLMRPTSDTKAQRMADRGIPLANQHVRIES